MWKRRSPLEHAAKFCFCSRMVLFENLGRVMAPGDRLKLECQGCGRLVALPREQAFKVFGAGASPYEVRRKAKCAGCGGRRVSVWV